jgi:hypothetical protein
MLGSILTLSLLELLLELGQTSVLNLRHTTQVTCPPRCLEIQLSLLDLTFDMRNTL